MFGALAAAVDVLRARGVPHALVGGTALAGRGVLRATDDFDVLVTSGEVLHEPFWAAARGLGVEIRVGDHDDPLAGVVCVSGSPADRALDVALLLEAGDRRAIAADVESRLGALPRAAREAWGSIARAR